MNVLGKGKRIRIYILGVAIVQLMTTSAWAKTKRDADLLHTYDVFRVTKAFGSEKRIQTQYTTLTSTLVINIFATTVDELSESVVDDEGNQYIQTTFEPYDQTGFNFIRTFSMIQRASNVSVQLKYVLHKNVTYSVVTKDNPYRLIITFSNKLSETE